MRLFFFIAVCLNFYSFSQVKVDHVFEERPTDTVIKFSFQNHSEILPKILYVSSRKTFDSVPHRKLLLSAQDLVDIGFRYGESSQLRSGLGFAVQALYGKKMYANFGCLLGVGEADSLFQPKSYVINRLRESYFSYGDVRGRVSYTPNSIFNFQVGLDHNFIGEGNRSFLLSDYGKPYPFAQIRAKLGRIEYLVLYQFFREQKKQEWFLKNGVTHYLSLNVTKNINFGLFESIIFQPKDTLLNRGFDVEYLNPVIFFRPQEYSLGSSDNSLLGGCFSLKYGGHVLYGQALLDEFSLAEIKAKTGWWANKYALQIGLKGRFNQGLNKFFYRIEYNVSKPYTFSHMSSGQNYGNQGMTLAHPLGANFRELLWEMKISHNKWLYKIFTSYYLQGRDKDGYSYGSNIYLPYTLRPSDYGIYVGQGLTNRAIRLIFTVSYQLKESGNLNVFVENQLRYESYNKQTLFFPIIGLRSQLWNDDRNF